MVPEAGDFLQLALTAQRRYRPPGDNCLRQARSNIWQRNQLLSTCSVDIDSVAGQQQALRQHPALRGRLAISPSCAVYDSQRGGDLRR
jgi:hypothetical protein